MNRWTFKATAFAIVFVAANVYSTLAQGQTSLKTEALDAPALAAPPRFALHAQTTYIWQTKPAFAAAYSGPNSLLPGHEKSYSYTATADLGLRLWPGAQLHLNPEATQGVPLSGLVGVGGISNGELQRGGSTQIKLYWARLFVQQRINLGDANDTIAPDLNEMGGPVSARRWTFTAGNFSLLDYFDNNPYAKDPRSQFMNWANLTYGAWDYAANARGYTWAGIAQYRAPGWALRYGRALQPSTSNGPQLDRSFTRQYGDQIELERSLPWATPGGPLRARVLLYRNRINGGSYADALALGVATASTPDVSLVRRPQTKTGWGLTLEAPLSDDAGLYVRASGNSGRLEEYAFTEIDRQLAVGGQFTGSPWGRGRDRWGVAYAINGLSPSHQSYLAAGGLGFFLGDGQLRYATERVFESYYNWTLPERSLGAGTLQSAISVGFQSISNPGYNRDRGPVQTYTVRLHSAF